MDSRTLLLLCEENYASNTAIPDVLLMEELPDGLLNVEGDLDAHENLILPRAALFCLFYWNSLQYALRQRALFMLLCVMGLIFLTLDS